jgi:hypothetical protein
MPHVAFRLINLAQIVFHAGQRLEGLIKTYDHSDLLSIFVEFFLFSSERK